MRFDMKNLNPARRYFFDEEKEEDGWVELRSLPISKTREIDEKTIITKEKIKRGQVIKDQVIKHQLRDKLTWDYVIADWLVYQPDGSTIECNAENKVKLMSESPDFAMFVAEKLGESEAIDAEAREEEEKNSETTPGK